MKPRPRFRLQTASRSRRLLLAALALCAGAPQPARAGDANLVPNAAFDAPGTPLAHWESTYDRPGESFYKDNASRVSVVADGARQAVLRLNVATRALADNQGVKAESAPIPFDPAGVYAFSAEARSTGPCARIMLEGFRRRKGAPAGAPAREDLRLVYRFPILTFAPDDSHETARPPRVWTPAAQRVPSEKLTPTAAAALAQVEFVVVRVVAIAGTSGDLFVDKIRLERRDAGAGKGGAP